MSAPRPSPSLAPREAARANEQRIQAAIAFIEHKKAQGVQVSVKQAAIMHGAPPSTVAARLKGRKTRQDAHVHRQTLGPEEDNVLVDWIIFWGGKGIPLNPNHVRAKAVAISGQDVGKHWIDRFKDRHSDRLKSTWTQPIEHSRAKAVNPAVVHDFYEKLMAEVNNSAIPQKNIYNADEKGVQFGEDERSKVLVEQTQRNTRMIHDKHREMATVIECICADGTAISPMVIFKGKRMSKLWFTQNFGGMSPVIATSSEGWTDQELGALWME
ncbi:SubName: Full=Related to transposase-Aspergillus fumigatus {ECO:0000313/EMBL:CCA75029.1} [Serendipita indica DSM 11827]|nr:SubName: Full=Related to transposase-Aspergillus fumigatus {ECO:0000313/EMBL:CCA75029.1} [Serendipita indica DSM 11827]